MGLEKLYRKRRKARKTEYGCYHSSYVVQRTQRIEKSAYESPMIPVILENIFYSQNGQSQERQLPRSDGKGVELVMTESSQEDSFTTRAAEAQILRTT